uniref:YchJ-like middle NTF2-like domain-containing protein n=2 Tax=Vibrionaceae TaxID=641 RepID=A0A5Q0TDF2_9VIBR|nr:YchJ family metal-binding protein [Vibrio sp. S11_S32]
MLCPCCSNIPYSQCCQPIHNDVTLAKQPEQLMRARYSAHVLKLVDFVVDTYHSSCQAPAQRAAIAESIESQWCRLEVVAASSVNNDQGYVEFKAYFMEGENEFCLHERSRFIKENGLWTYIDGFMPQSPQLTQSDDPRLNQSIQSLKVGRNDPCICGSGKKFKKCCG